MLTEIINIIMLPGYSCEQYIETKKYHGSDRVAVIVKIRGKPRDPAMRPAIDRLRDREYSPGAYIQPDKISIKRALTCIANTSILR